MVHGHALGLRVGGEGVLRLGHADWQRAKAHLRVELDLLLGLGRVLHRLGTVDLLGDGFDLALDGDVKGVEVPEAPGALIIRLTRALARRRHRFGHCHGPLPAFGVVFANDSRVRPGRHGSLAHFLELLLRVRGEAVDAHDDRHAKLVGILDVLLHVADAGLDERQVLLRVLTGDRPASGHLGSLAVHFEGPHGGHEEDAVGAQARVAALDVEELLHANVRAKSCLRHDIALLAHELEGDLVRHNGRVAVGNVGEGTRVHEHGRALESLHERGHDRILHKYCEGSANAEVVCCDRLARARCTNDHGPQALAHVLKSRGQGEHRHDLRCHADVVAGLPRHALLSRALAYSDLAQEAVIHVDDSVP
mmetsp:Transcript_14595/g.39308  ORF Transcript_14595/g.39308 Transcript_14595/m.39308 type:complete len:364 (+) Transcript_14595:281-1372(+)